MLPININGTEIPNHINNSSIKEKKSTAPELSSSHIIKFMTKNIPKQNPGKRSERLKEFVFQWIPPNSL